MLRRVRSHLTYANVVATLALVIAIGGGTAYAVATIGSDDVINESLRGVDVKNRSLSGEDLGVRVRSARQVDDASPAAVCGQTADWDECITVNFTVPRPQRLLLVGSGEWSGSSSAGGNLGECRFSVGALTQLGHRRFGEVGTGPSSPYNLAMNSVTRELDPGFYEIGIDCRDDSPASGGMTVKSTELSVVAVGDG